MTADRFARTCQKVGLVCVGQEIISWGDARKMIDCISLFAKPGSRWERPNVVVLNPDFMAEASSAQRAASVHSSLFGLSSGQSPASSIKNSVGRQLSIPDH